MKQLITSTLCVLFLAALLTACGAGISDRDREDLRDAWEDAQDEGWDEAWDAAWSGVEDAVEDGKQHNYQILDGQTEEELYTVTDAAQVETLDDLLSGAGKDWQRETSGPEDGETVSCIYVFRQEKTRLAGEDPQAERDYEEIIRFTVYQDRDLVTIQVLKDLGGRLETAGNFLEDLLTFHVSVPAEDMKALRNPAQFADSAA